MNLQDEGGEGCRSITSICVDSSGSALLRFQNLILHLARDLSYLSRVDIGNHLLI